MQKTRLDAGALDLYVAGLRPEFERNLGRLVEIPSVSMDPDRKADMKACADFAVELLRALGAEARAIDTPLHPLVYGLLV